jgi:hypothetical protein
MGPAYSLAGLFFLARLPRNITPAGWHCERKRTKRLADRLAVGLTFARGSILGLPILTSADRLVKRATHGCHNAETDETRMARLWLHAEDPWPGILSRSSRVVPWASTKAIGRKIRW